MRFFRYLIKVLPLPYFLTSERNENKLSGYIDTSLFSYITPLMLTIIAVVSIIVYFNISTLYTYFSTNIPLNGLIVFLLLISLIQAFNNNFQLYKTACFLKMMENMGEQPEVTDEDAQKLHRKLEKDTPLLNTKQMHGVIVNFQNFGHPTFSDNDARIIKSKLGYRIRLRRSDVGFNAGILVMLGLLGTFLGLLATIDSIGAALKTMSGIGSDGEVTTEQMGSFISALAAPLQGMGLAFSTSLYGLSGSLLIGFFNHLCGGAQDTFIEAVSRWVDNRIPQFDPEKAQDDPTNKTPSSDDLKTWLSGFVYLSVKTNKKIGALTHTLVDTIKETGNIRDYLDKIADNQVVMSDRLQEATSAIDVLNGHGSILVENIVQSTNALNDLRDASQASVSEIKRGFGDIAASMNDFAGQQNAIVEYARLSSDAVGDLKLTYRQDIDEIKHSLESISPSVAKSLTESSLATQGILRQLTGHIDEIKAETLDPSYRNSLGEALTGIRGELEKIHADHAQTVVDFSAYRTTPETLKLHLTRTEALLEQINQGQKLLVNKLAEMQKDNASSAHNKAANDELAGMAVELRELLNEINNENEMKFNDIFGIGNKSKK